MHRARAPEDPTAGTALVIGTLDKEIIRRVVRRHKNELRFCYELGLQRHPELAGRVVTEFIIAGNGRVVGAAVQKSSLADPAVEECVAKAVRRWEFPAVAQLTTVYYPFVFTGQE
jgi:TonB family protein